MKKYILFGIVAVALISLAASSYSITGLFSKAFDKTLDPGENYERNITIRNYYNLTVRFQKENSTYSLTFDNNESIVVLKDADGNEVARNTGLVNGKTYFFVSTSIMDTIKTVSAYNLGEYLDIVDQTVNMTYSGTTAYITLKVKYKPSSISGYVVDKLTNQTVQGVEVIAFENEADPVADEPMNQDTSDSNGRYTMNFQLNDSKSLDIYVKDFEVD